MHRDYLAAAFDALFYEGFGPGKVLHFAVNSSGTEACGEDHHLLVRLVEGVNLGGKVSRLGSHLVHWDAHRGYGLDKHQEVIDLQLYISELAA